MVQESATYVSMLWTVILGCEVWKCLVETVDAVKGYCATNALVNCSDREGDRSVLLMVNIAKQEVFDTEAGSSFGFYSGQKRQVWSSLTIAILLLRWAGGALTEASRCMM